MTGLHTTKATNGVGGTGEVLNALAAGSSATSGAHISELYYTSKTSLNLTQHLPVRNLRFYIAVKRGLTSGFYVGEERWEKRCFYLNCVRSVS